MPDQSDRLGLPYILPSQAQKHVTHNEALRRLDALVQLTVESFDALTPPPLPETGTCYALGAAPTGEWAGQGGHVAVREADGWRFVAPREGWLAWGRAEAELRVSGGGRLGAGADRGRGAGPSRHRHRARRDQPPGGRLGRDAAEP